MDTSEIIVVSGLPRSGTSLMMQMLVAGGVTPVTDGERVADDDNPRGYYELEAVKKLKTNGAWLADARGKGVKIISQLLLDLPPTERYRVIFMRRDLDEVLDSQTAMIARRGGAALPRERMKGAFASHLTQVEAWLARQSHVALQWVDYSRLVAEPVEQAATVNAFLGGGLDEAKMIAAIDPALYRNRRSP